ncbi:hypothetical protein [Mariniradius saccharolyticus]|uniref:hypothetical protein n=1 Tax=Mariniradius saccharolyticus TaxID=1245591 RepID=UPI0002A69282|nr:hypothetical protein [Mariniradius saccharolyticus]
MMENQNNSLDKAGKDQVNEWQKKLLPFLIGLPVVLALAFIYLANKQVSEFYDSVGKKGEGSYFDKALFQADSLGTGKSSETRDQWLILLHLEEESIKNRYNQAGLLLISRVLTKYLGFFTGMVLAILGAVFIIGKLSESRSEIGAEFKDQVKFNIISASPGIIFGVLGTILMITTIVTSSEIKVNDQPLFLNTNSIQVMTNQTKQTGKFPEIELIPEFELDSTDRK